MKRILKAQSIFEYFVLFLIFTIAVLLVFGSFKVKENKVKSLFDEAIDKAIEKLNE